ncbi:MAG: hypothetical protein KC438_02310 [Thermomicrobiales bacterium]|nr:hypothetical protein [Thermomicrobiales bacterium]MCO5222439.1 hypothetical protein [Thermomicrobiales bacterium]
MNRRQFVGASGAIALSLSASLPRVQVQAQAAYSAIDLGFPDGFPSIVPVALNNNGVAVVEATAADKSAIFIVENGTFTRLGDEDAIVHATSINDTNAVGGWIEDAGDGSGPVVDLPVLLTPEGQALMPGNQLDGRVHALSSDGRAVGAAATDERQSARRAVVWDNQEVSELKGIPTDAASSASDINSLGQIVGRIETPDESAALAVLLSLDEDPVELGTIGGAFSEAVAISERGQIAGNSSTSDEQTSLSGDGIAAFSWSEGTLTPLPTLENQAWSNASDINSFGLISGTVGLTAPATASPATTAVVWAPDSVLELNQVIQPIDGLILTAAVAINEMGQVLCTAVDTGGASHAVLLSVMGN